MKNRPVLDISFGVDVHQLALAFGRTRGLLARPAGDRAVLPSSVLLGLQVFAGCLALVWLEAQVSRPLVQIRQDA